ncbi:MAG TPA: hypothetical protein VL494_13490 [Steroidobacteraceae bacterium]|jgi:hypothetical protein|nr:hypothetical protein [Steroidobacteraceae bacterium]
MACAPAFDMAAFTEFERETERRLRREGLFDAADIYREHLDRFPASDVTVFDRGRPTALDVILGDAVDWKRGLTIYPERE